MNRPSTTGKMRINYGRFLSLLFLSIFLFLTLQYKYLSRYLYFRNVGKRIR